MGKIIAFSGSHGTGKTTAAHALAVKLKLNHPEKRIGFLPETARECPYPINREADALGQLWIFGKQLERELGLCAGHDIVVADRCLLDVAAYTMAVFQTAIGWDMAKIYADLLERGHYQEIRFMEPKNAFLVDDGVRDTDQGFQEEVSNVLRSLHKKFGGPVVWPQGDENGSV